jgi:hypothetical protein
VVERSVRWQPRSSPPPSTDLIGSMTRNSTRHLVAGVIADWRCLPHRLIAHNHHSLISTKTPDDQSSEEHHESAPISRRINASVDHRASGAIRRIDHRSPSTLRRVNNQTDLEINHGTVVRWNHRSSRAPESRCVAADLRAELGESASKSGPGRRFEPPHEKWIRRHYLPGWWPMTMKVWIVHSFCASIRTARRT